MYAWMKWTERQTGRRCGQDAIKDEIGGLLIEEEEDVDRSIDRIVREAEEK
ncbi:MAG: hypothetical protein JRD89_21375 [Deltaproteobacteria bacterium]|nr:hypothetical protein [Deltaproteobacteria bacterium]